MTPSREQDYLLPCPFCGGKPVRGMANVWCESCGAQNTDNFDLSAEEQVMRWNQRTRLSSPSVPEGWKRFAENVVQDVCEIPNRDSPEDFPEACVVTPQELTDIIERNIERLSESQPPLTPSRSDGLANNGDLARCQACGRSFYEDEPPSHHSGAVKVPDDVCKSLGKMLGKLDEEDKDTLNWLLFAHHEVKLSALRHPSSTGASSGDATKSMLASPPSASAQGWQELYHELLYAVGKKFPYESRHQTALRYIRQCENAPSEPAQAQEPKS